MKKSTLVLLIALGVILVGAVAILVWMRITMGPALGGVA